MGFRTHYWRDHPGAPFAELLSVVETQCHPEAYVDAYEDLRKFVRDPSLQERMRLFREQLAQAIADPAQVPSGALSEAAQYDDGSDANFLRRLWRDLYPDEPVPHDGNVFEDQYRRDDPDAPFAGC